MSKQAARFRYAVEAEPQSSLPNILGQSLFSLVPLASSPTAKDGSTQVMTEAVHPFQAFHEVHFKLDWTPTPKMKKDTTKEQEDEDGSGRWVLLKNAPNYSRAISAKCYTYLLCTTGVGQTHAQSTTIGVQRPASTVI